MLEGAVARTPLSRWPSQQFFLAASIPSFLQFFQIVSRIFLALGRFFTLCTLQCVPDSAFCLLPICRSGPCERRMPL